MGSRTCRESTTDDQEESLPEQDQTTGQTMDLEQNTTSINEEDPQETTNDQANQPTRAKNTFHDTSEPTGNKEFTSDREPVEARTAKVEAPEAGEAQSKINNRYAEKTSSNENTTVPDRDRFSEKQLKVLRAIRDRPYATQAELAEEFNISRATISQRVNAIEGFEWRDRQEFVDTLFIDHEPLSDGNGLAESVEELSNRIDALVERVAVLEQTVEEQSEPNTIAFEDPEIAAIVIRACIDSDLVTDEQEEEIILELIESKQSSSK